MSQQLAEVMSWSPCPCFHFCPPSSTLPWQSFLHTKGVVEAVERLWPTHSHLPVSPTEEPRVIKGWHNSALVKVRLHTLASRCKKHKFLPREMHLCVSKVHLPSLLPCWILFLAPPAGSAWMGCFICHLSLGSVSLRKSVSKMKGKAWSLILKELISLLKCIFLSSSIFLPPPILKWGAFLSFFFLLITVKLSGSFIPPFQA